MLDHGCEITPAEVSEAPERIASPVIADADVVGEEVFAAREGERADDAAGSPQRVNLVVERFMSN